MITRKLSYNPENERWAVHEGYNTTNLGIIVFEGPIESNENETVTYEVCLQLNFQYSLVLWDIYDEGWSIDSTIHISIDTITLLVDTLETNDTSDHVKKIIPFQINYLIAPGSIWKTTSMYNCNNVFMLLSYSDIVWTSLAPGSFPVISTTTRYYRYTSSFVDTSAYALRIGIKTNSGFIAYVNGIEASRVGLPDVKDSNTVSLTAETEATWKTFVIPASLYISLHSSILIAVEVHSHPSQLMTEDTFNAYVSPIISTDGEVVTAGGNVTCSVESSNIINVCTNVVDDFDDTKYNFPGNTATITIALPNGSKTCMDPREWKFYGSEDGGITWIFLDHVINNKFAARGTSYTFNIPSNRKSFNQIKFDILNNNGDSYTQLAEIRTFVTNQPLVAPGLQYPSPTLNIYTYMSVSVAPISSGIHTYTVSPDLPTGLFFNSINGAIYGSVTTTSPTIIYAISAIDGATNAATTFTMTISVIACQQPIMAQVTVTKVNKSTSKDERVVIYTEDNTQIITLTGVNNGTNQVLNECQPAGRWKFVLFDDNNDGWGKGAYLDVSLKYDLTTEHRIARLYLLAGTTATYYVNTRLDLGPKSAWKYQQGAPTDVTWKTISFFDTHWKTLTYSPLVSVTERIILLRKTFTITSKTNMVGWELFFKSKDGSVIYVNGNEVYRYNLIAGEITAVTTPIGGENSFLWRSVSGAMTTLSNGNSVTIAIALVNLGTTSYNLEFDGLFRLLGDANVIQNAADGNYDSSGVFSDGNPEYLFDSVPRSRWISDEHDSVTEKWVTVEFNNKRAIYMNKYCLISNRDSPQHDPADWTIYGSMDERKQRQCFFALGTTQAYTNYKISITKATEILPQNKYAFAEWEFLMIDAASIVIPPFTFNPTNLVAYKGGIIPALLVSSEYYYDFSIFPALPTGLSMDSSNGYFNGIATQLQSPTAYTISAKNIQGTPVATTITFSVIACSYPNNLFKLRFYFSTYANEASWTLKDSTGTTVASKTTAINYSTQNFIYCRAAGIYTLVMSDSKNDGWGDGTYSVFVEDSTTALVSGSLAVGESPKTVTLNIGRIVSSTATWKYLNSGSEAPSGWNTATFSDAVWTSGISGSLPVPTGTTQYYRTTFTLATIDPAYAGLDIGASTYAGMIIYLNGQEIRRINMPAGAVNYNTLATSILSNPMTFTGSISLVGSTILTTGTNVIAIEIHKKDTLPASNVFDGYASFIASGEYRVLDGISSSDVEKIGFEGTDKLFDNKIDTKVVSGPRCVGAWFQWTYNQGRREFINQYKVSNANDCNQRHPSGWRIEGSNDGATWTLLHYAHNQYFTSFKQTFDYNFYAAQPYNAFRMVVTECSNTPLDSVGCGDGNIQLSELGFYITNTPAACAASGTWGPAPEGGFSFQECANGYTGIQRRLCTAGVFGEVQQLCTLVAPTNLAYAGSPYTYHKNVPVSLAATVTGAALTFTIDPALASGLSINPSTGVISGTPLANSALTTYTVTATNTTGSVTTTIMIQVDTASCAADGTWPITEAGQQATLACLDTINYEGSRTRLCQVSYPAVWGSVVDGCQLKMPTIMYSTTTITGYKNDAINPVIATVTGGSLNPLTIAPSLPTGLSFNAQNGQISGTPVAASTDTYTVTASNARGQATAVITINISVVNCTLDGIWPATEKTNTVYTACPNGQSGVQIRTCIYEGFGNAIWSTPDTSNCFVYNDLENANENYHFIYVPIIIEGITEEKFNSPLTIEHFRTIIINYLHMYSIPSTNVKVIKASSQSTDSRTLFITIQIISEDIYIEMISNDLNTYLTGPNSDLLHDCISSIDDHLNTITNASLNGSITIGKNITLLGFKLYIFIVTALALVISPVVIIIVISLFCVYQCLKKKCSNKRRLLVAHKKMNTKTQVVPDSVITI
ncbi:hypothetical protein WA158_007805 [Blastocystis sp. Blastoise]